MINYENIKIGVIVTKEKSLNGPSNSYQESLHSHFQSQDKRSWPILDLATPEDENVFQVRV